MPRVPPLYPPPGTSAVADAIRARRGARGLSPLDGTLLQSPAYAAGWNQLLGAVRSQTSTHLPHDVREIIILRVAARNRAAFEWIQHEPVARNEGGVGDDALAAVRNTGIAPSSPPVESGELTPPAGPLSELQAAAVVFTDESTVNVRVQDSTFNRLRDLLLAEGKRRAQNEDAVREALGSRDGETIFADRAIAEATATAATYNMVSRFLVALDIDGRSLQPVPGPVEPATFSSAAPNQTIPMRYPLQPAAEPITRNMIRLPLDGQLLSTLFHPADSARKDAPTIICINSLMTDLSMWDHVLPALRAHYNVITYDQRGHGHSSIPPQGCTLAQLADDAAAVLDAYHVERAHAILGVSQGGATALAFLLRHTARAARIVACDTQAKSPEANVKAWDERIALARKEGMGALADATLPRWYASLFPAGSGKEEDVAALEQAEPRRQLILNHTAAMIRATPVEGFASGARALQGYDLLASTSSPGLLDVLAHQPSSQTPSVLLVAGTKDGALPAGLRKLAEDAHARGADARRLRFAEVEGAGHLPMIDQPQAWLDAVLPFLAEDAGLEQ
ncbi:hypothetical protein OC835_004238 [Tilletia horrida]|nr:hypothetical protein OC835_004238 [Tilletia horrida]KAK0559513.1 hypothetical protein OC844_004347 [Tilletia horrida]